MNETFLKPSRFDIGAKYAYALFREHGIDCEWALEVYKRHLELWNGFVEYDNPHKNTCEKFINCFNDILDSVKKDGFDSTKPIPISATGIMLNGVHRATACLLHNKDPTLYISQNPMEFGGWHTKNNNYKMFQGLGLEQKYMDFMALEYVKLNPKSYTFIVFPTAGFNVENIIARFGSIVYKKEIELTEIGSYNLTRQLYKGEDWLGNWQNGFYMAANKAKSCWGESKAPLQLYIVDFDTFDISRECKLEVRKILNFQTPKQDSNRFCHTNDNHEQSLRVARMLLNDNGIHYINNMKLVYNPKLIAWLDHYKKYIEEHEWNPDDFCVSASAVLSVYGLRDCQDLDYLHHDPQQQIGNHSMIHTHETELAKYTMKKDEIIYNPENYFYYDDIKFASLNVIKALKEKRGEPKDKVDIEHINQVLFKDKPNVR